MERLFTRTLSVGLSSLLLFGAVSAQYANKNNTVIGSVDEDLYFVNSVFFPDFELPETLDAETGTSTASFEGSGSVTVGSQKSGGFPRITMYGGTTISVERTYEGEDNVNHEWWEGSFFAPSFGQTNIEIDGADSANGDNIARYITEAVFEFGQGNETFSFSPAATLVADVGGAVSNGERLYLASATGSINEVNGEELYSIDGDAFCWVQDGFCIIDIDSAQSVALVREVFEKCPARNEVSNGFITGPPNCLLQCDRGYVADENGRYCVAEEGNDSGFGEGFVDDFSEGSDDLLEPNVNYQADPDVEYPKGYFKYREARGVLGRGREDISLEGLSGEERRVAEKIKYGTLKTVGESQPAQQVADNSQAENDSFLNYLLSFRGKGTQGAAVVASSEANGGEELIQDDVLTINNDNNDGATYGSAPLLPSTGAAGIFWVLAAVGLGMMAFAVKRK